MKIKQRWWTSAPFVLMALASNCGIEVGNPHGGSKTPKTGGGTLSVALADAPVDGAQHVYFNIKSLSVIPTGSTDPSAQVTVALANSGKIDALALQGGKTLDLSTEQALPAGIYGAVVLGLDETTPATIVDKDGNEEALPFADAAHGIYVAQEFEVVEGQALELTLHLDLRRSISHREGDEHHRFDFGPVANIARRGAEGTIVGAVPAGADVVEVCAYSRHRGPPPGGGPGGPPPGPVRDPNGRPPPPPNDPSLPPNAAIARQPPIFEAGADFGADQDVGCAKAFATAGIVNSIYTLTHLWPGEYHLAFYKADGTRSDAPPREVDVYEGQTVTLGVGP